MDALYGVMLRRSHASLLVVVLPALAALTACGSNADPNALRFEQNATETDPAGGEEAQSSLGGGASNTTSGPTCASSTLRAEGLPLRLVLVLDRSGSMCQTNDKDTSKNCSDPASRWRQAVGALTAFAGSAESKGITADLIPFPATNADQCDANSYDAPAGGSVTFPDATGTLASRLQASTPQVNGQTPTEVAMDGATRYAEQLAAENVGKARVAIVIATDGEPKGCGDNGSIEPAAKHAERIKTKVPTYVIGVGSSLALDRLAQAGGTDKAVLVDTADPAKLTQNLGAALAQIRGSALGCQFKLPVSTGDEADPKRVNVKFTAGGGAMTRVGYDEGCAKGTGWRYDDAAHPTQIELCGSACGQVKVDAKAQVDIELGCATEIVK